MASHASRNILHRWHYEVCGQKKQMYEDARGLHKKMAVYLFLFTFCRVKKVINCHYFLNSHHIFVAIWNLR